MDSPLGENAVSATDEGLYEPTVELLDARQWQFVRRRFRMTPRELEVARLACRGWANEQIAEHLRIQVGTVKVHLRNLYRKLRINSKVTMLLRFVEETASLP